MNEFGSYLKKLRKSKQLSGKTFAELCGFGQSYVSQIETGVKGIPSPETIRRMSNVLGVTHIGMMIKAGYVTEEEVLTYRKQAGISD
ncbi:helix-turn-helix transcriptional regulator [Paenibacillus macerans]|uniref:helix-turn-helix domain-containing protein n=1 Tax=Paenibacillus macerans TaxID=44252 RepID=UPI002DBCFFD0|nr:helix-turn-helix transcriptional regulator [Paenibacillus macerans]MEC0140776.1 helix-turn-helix transcriptional regulator [Paenibacillus macerans]